MSAFTISLLIVAVVGGGVALVLAAVAQRSAGQRPQNSADAVIDLRTPADPHRLGEPTTETSVPSSHGGSRVASHQLGQGTTAIAELEPQADSAPGPYTKLTAHQGRKLGADRPLWRRALSGIALLIIVVLIGVLIATGIGMIAGLASLLVERSV